MEESKIINVTQVKPNRSVAEIAVQTGYSLNGRIEQFESIDYSEQRDGKVNMSEETDLIPWQPSEGYQRAKQTYIEQQRTNQSPEINQMAR